MIDDSTTVSLHTPAGPVTIDLKEGVIAYNAALQGTERQPTAACRCREGYLGGKTSSVTAFWSYRKGELVISELETYIEDGWDVDRFTRFENYGRDETAPEYRTVKIAFDSSAVVAIQSTRCLKNRLSGDRIVVRTSIDCDGDHRVRVFFNSDDVTRAKASAFITGLIDHYHAHGPQRGAVFDAHDNFIRRDSGASDKLVLAPITKALVDRHIFGAFRLRERIASAGMETCKGVILSGPPGTGKTLLIKSIAEQTDMTVIVVSPDMIQPGTISKVYKTARRYSPSLVVLEDIDSAGGLSRKIADHPVLGEVLQALDGISSNAGVYTVASSNHIERLDSAILDRPGRFSRIINIDVHDVETRRTLLGRLASDYGVKDVDLDWLTQNTHGFSGDWATELIETALKIAWLDERDTATTEDFRDALDDIDLNRSQAYKPTQ
ncbi:MAG: AAA family ATPase, partial [Myxococcota bacterium]